MDAKKTIHQTLDKAKKQYDDFLDFTPILMPKWGAKIRPYAKWIYVVATIYLAFSLIGACLSMLGNHLSGLVQAIMTIGLFFIVRMWCELIINKPQNDKKK